MGETKGYASECSSSISTINNSQPNIAIILLLKDNHGVKVENDFRGSSPTSNSMNVFTFSDNRQKLGFMSLSNCLIPPS